MRLIIFWFAALFLLGVVCELFLYGNLVSGRDTVHHRCPLEGSVPDLLNWFDYAVNLTIAVLIARGISTVLLLFKCFHKTTDDVLDFSVWGRLALLILLLVPFTLFVLTVGAVSSAPFNYFTKGLPKSGQHACVTMDTSLLETLCWLGFAGSTAFIISLLGVGTRHRKHRL